MKSVANQTLVYFVSLSSNAPAVLTAAIEKSANHSISIFFDLDGAHVLDMRYLRKLNRTHGTDLEMLLKTAIQSGIKLFGCQMNVLIADGLELIDGAELSGVASFLEIAYEADAVLSY